MRTYKVKCIVQEKDSFLERKAILLAFDYNDAKQMCENAIKNKDWESYADLLPNFEEPAATLRDQFAIAALQGILSDPHRINSERKILVKEAYLFADALLAEREKK